MSQSGQSRSATSGRMYVADSPRLVTKWLSNMKSISCPATHNQVDVGHACETIVYTKSVRPTRLPDSRWYTTPINRHSYQSYIDVGPTYKKPKGLSTELDKGWQQWSIYECGPSNSKAHADAEQTIFHELMKVYILCSYLTGHPEQRIWVTTVDEPEQELATEQRNTW